MEKERGAILLVLLLLLICVGWLSVSFYQIPATQKLAAVAAPTLDTKYVPQGSITIYATAALGQESYSGSLDLPACDTLGTAISTNWGNPARASIALQVLSYPACTAVGTTTSPFLVSVSMGNATTTPVLGGITINGAPVTLTLIER